ncbi:hypothetical protein [Siphonobacter sp. SORGH_AS_1065]|uniref:hypothetical protein n=1 Tax=Siphonobacter sp. SORGH_AS_1065 TaxID=3041795 RepID=UPI00278A32B2|nr:hypothetical protein [Siphonobacter sp. SORGH_AS_1065]MDQ1088440.1 hypothetical protein [Siphonobacter sp. SORGH_AS_1065]
MKKSVFLFFLLISCNCFAQVDTLKNNYLRIQPSQVLLRELALEYEQPVTKRLTIGLGAGYRFPKRGQPSEIGELISMMAADYRFRNVVNPPYHGLRLSIAPRYYLNPRKTLFISAELFVRYWWFNNVPSDYQKTTNSYGSIKSEHMDVRGGKLLIGYNSPLLSLPNGHKLYYTPFGGFGLRSKEYLYITQYNNISTSRFEKESGKIITPSIHMGIFLAYTLSK